MTYNIVEVVPGQYAIRRRTFFQELFSLDGEFLDLVATGDIFWWDMQDSDFPDCLTDNVESLTLKLQLLKSLPKVII